jgi:hypothetical protein
MHFVLEWQQSVASGAELLPCGWWGPWDWGWGSCPAFIAPGCCPGGFGWGLQGAQPTGEIIHFSASRAALHWAVQQSVIQDSIWSSCSLPGSEWLPVGTSLPQQCAWPQSTRGMLLTPEVHGCWQVAHSLGLSNMFSSRVNDHFLFFVLFIYSFLFVHSFKDRASLCCRGSLWTPNYMPSASCLLGLQV